MTESPLPRARTESIGAERPDFFIVGAPKSGTSALAAYLAAHPQVFMGPKEMHTFGSDLCFVPRFYRRDRAAYLAEFRARRGQPRAGEASVWYLFSRRAAAELHSFNPQARIVILLRRPIEMLYSLFFQFRFDGNEPLPTFRAALAAEPERRAGRGLGRSTYLPQGLCYREVARYAEQVERYYHVFGRERVHVSLYDELRANPPAVGRAVLDFLDLNPIDLDIPVVNGNKAARHPALGRLLNEPLLRRAALALRPWLPASCFTGLQRLENRLLRSNSRAFTRPPLDPRVRAELKREFAPEFERLGDLIGRDLSTWSD